MIYDLLIRIPDGWLVVGITVILIALAVLGWGRT